VAHKNKPLTQADKRRLIAEKLRVAPELSNRAIARMLGVSPTTVGSVRRDLADKMSKMDRWTQVRRTGRNTLIYGKIQTYLRVYQRGLAGS
jgi:predicted transcriptional regulator